MYIDTHCHLSKEDYSSLDEVVHDAYNANVKKLIISGCDKKSIEESIITAEKYENVYLALGYHPSEANVITKQDIERLEDIVKSNKKVIAIGEIGLDYHWEKDNKETQQSLFKSMIELAKKYSLPVVIHSRDAFQDTYDILKKSKVKGVIHCFSGNIENAKMYISLGFKLGIGGVLTFKNSKLKDVLKELELSNIVTETDSPYLTPEPYRGKINEPKYVKEIISKISEIKEMDIESVEKIIEQNVKDTFGI